MNSENIVLDYENQQHDPEDFIAGIGLRIANFFLDRFFLYLLIFIEASIFDSFFVTVGEAKAIAVLLFLFTIPGYWIIFEYIFGKTPAKFLTKIQTTTDLCWAAAATTGWLGCLV